VETLDGFDGYRRGDLARGVSAHPVDDEEQAEIRAEREDILVARAVAALGAAAGSFDVDR
jgi:hypothetical protein